MNYSSKTATKELEQIAEKFKKDKNLDEFCQGVSEVAEKLGHTPMFVYRTLAGHMNLEMHGGTFYECEEAKSEKADCGKCIHFMNEADTCIENSIITPVYRILYPEHKSPHFERRGPTHLIEMK